jgi:anti-anti-sigma factor
MFPAYASTREVREVIAEEEAYGSFRLSCRRPDHDIVVVTIIGDLELQSVAQTQAFLRHAAARSPRHLIVDVSQVSFLSSSGISLLIGVHDGRSGRNGALLKLRTIPTRLHLVGARENPHVARPLALLGMLDHFATAPDLDALVAGMLEQL